MYAVITFSIVLLAVVCKLATKPQEKWVIQRSKEIRLTEKLLNFSLTADEGGEYVIARNPPRRMTKSSWADPSFGGQSQGMGSPEIASSHKTLLALTAE